MLRTRYITAFLSPWMVSFVLFWLFPLLFALYLSFTAYSPLGGDLSVTGADSSTLANP